MIKGDHLVSPRTGYDHHGLYVGDEKVIHYSGFSEFLNKGSIEITTLEKFENGHGSTVKKHIFSVFDAEERVKRAYSKIGEDSYNLLFNNCEHFVHWCFNDFNSSSQVNNTTVAVTTIASKVIKNKTLESATTASLEQTAKTASKELVKSSASKVVTKSLVSGTAGTAAGLTTGGAIASTAGLVGIASSTTVIVPVVTATVGYYGVKKLFDWLLD